MSLTPAVYPHVAPSTDDANSPPPPLPVHGSSDASPSIVDDAFLAPGLSRAVDAQQGLTETISIDTPNSSHLFWVPASQHPEIAPTEYENYVHTLRSNSINKGKVKRRRSVLSQSFTANDSLEDLAKVENHQENDRDDALAALENNLYRSRTTCTLEDDAKLSPTAGLDAEQVKARKKLLRRSQSLQLPGDNNGIPDFLVFDRHSTTLDQSPILANRVNRPLSRRGARTKFQRTPVQPSSSVSTRMAPMPSDDDHVARPDRDDHAPPQLPDHQFHHQLDHRSQNEEAPTQQVTALAIASPPSPPSSPPQIHHMEPEPVDTKAPAIDGPGANASRAAAEQGETAPLLPGTHQNQQNQHLPPTFSPPEGSRRISPPPGNAHPEAKPQPKPEPSKSASVRKSTWSWSFWSDEKKSKVEDDDEAAVYNAASDDSASVSSNNGSSKQRFGLSSLFSRKPSSATTKSRTEDTSTRVNGASYTPTSFHGAPKDFQLNPKMNRLPIHTERAIYRLSHMKLANPRRPLHEQVIISNFMFWYLGIVSQQQQQQQQQQQPNQQQGHAIQGNQGQQGAPPSPLHAQQRPGKPAKPGKPGGRKGPSKSSHQQQQQSLHQQQRRMQPRTPEQIAHAANKNKKKRNSPPGSSSPATAPSSHQQQPEKRTSAWQDSLKQPSTGFVIPDNYLRPQQRAASPPPPQASASSSPSNSPSTSPHRPLHPKSRWYATVAL
ncbi:hypothetical protein BC940DRAFT_346198 [Gongronella butleri]|nr:hypothetical protein BC940DRAFT_346198 [Gongronella butleri]